jgi:hypothetical protein
MPNLVSDSVPPIRLTAPPLSLGMRYLIQMLVNHTELSAQEIREYLQIFLDIDDEKKRP